MSAIGGMVRWGGKGIDTRPLFSMSRAMLSRGGMHRDAYVKGDAALFQNHGQGSPVRLPLSLAREGANCTLVLDGTPSFSSLGEELGDALWDLSHPESVLRAYCSFGGRFADVLCGAFSLAIVDEARGELYLARDAEGARPLFYLWEDDTFYFASEVKALLRVIPSAARIDAGHLRLHLISPYGTFSAENLYREIHALPAGHSALLSRLGFRLFRNESTETVPPFSPTFSCDTLYLPEERELSSMLTNLLFAFDYPQFDYLMPTLLRRLSELRGRGAPCRLVFEDPSLYMNLGYAGERADRIGAMFGVTAIPAAPERFFAKERELRRLERTARSLLGSVDTSDLRDLLGEHWSAQISREKNTAKRIRMEGMAYQTLLWVRNFPLLLA